MSVKPLLAILEDDNDLRENLIVFLSSLGYITWGANSAENFFRELAVHPADIIVLNLNISDGEGLSVLKHLQHTQDYSCIVISEENTLEDKKVALIAGAKGYFVKPINIQTLLTHIQKIQTEKKQKKSSTKVSLNWRLVEDEQILYAPNGRSLSLTSAEYKLLNGLMSVPNQTFTKNEILNILWKGQSKWRDYHGVEVLLSRLRSKCLKNLKETLPVRSVQAVGLVFTALVEIKIKNY